MSAASARRIVREIIRKSQQLQNVNPLVLMSTKRKREEEEEEEEEVEDQIEYKKKKKKKKEKEKEKEDEEEEEDEDDDVQIKYKGVTEIRTINNKKRFKAQIWIHNTMQCLGAFDTSIEVCVCFQKNVVFLVSLYHEKYLYYMYIYSQSYIYINYLMDTLFFLFFFVGTGCKST